MGGGTDWKDILLTNPGGDEDNNKPPPGGSDTIPSGPVFPSTSSTGAPLSVGDTFRLTTTGLIYTFSYAHGWEVLDGQDAPADPSYYIKTLDDGTVVGIDKSDPSHVVQVPLPATTEPATTTGGGSGTGGATGTYVKFEDPNTGNVYLYNNKNPNDRILLSSAQTPVNSQAAALAALYANRMANGVAGYGRPGGATSGTAAGLYDIMVDALSANPTKASPALQQWAAQSTPDASGFAQTGQDPLTAPPGTPDFLSHGGDLFIWNPDTQQLEPAPGLTPGAPDIVFGGDNQPYVFDPSTGGFVPAQGLPGGQTPAEQQAARMAEIQAQQSGATQRAGIQAGATIQSAEIRAAASERTTAANNAAALERLAKEQEFQGIENQKTRDDANFWRAREEFYKNEEMRLKRIAEQGKLAEQFANVISNPDPTKLRAFLTAGGGSIWNALQGGNTAVSDLANLPAARTLQAISNLAGQAVGPPGPAVAPSSQPPPVASPTSPPPPSGTATSSAGPVFSSGGESKGGETVGPAPARRPRRHGYFAQQQGAVPAFDRGTKRREGVPVSTLPNNTFLAGDSRKGRYNPEIVTVRNPAPDTAVTVTPTPPSTGQVVSREGDHIQRDVSTLPPPVATPAAPAATVTPPPPGGQSSVAGVGPTPPAASSVPEFTMNSGAATEAVTPADRPFLETVQALRESAIPGAREAIQRMNLLDFFAQDPTLQASDILQIGTAFGIPPESVWHYINTRRLRGQQSQGSLVVGV